MTDTVHPLESVPPVVANSGQADLEPEDQGGATLADAGSDSDEGLSAREVRFCDLLATGTPPAEAARLVGIAARSGRRWRQKARLQAAVRSRLNDAVAVGRSILASGMARASRALVEMSDGTEEAAPGRVSAARAVVESAVQLCDLETVKSQLAAIEAQLAANGGKQRWT
ncbi:MAG: hypothetical protein WCG85_02330 [Polyangia bacterium]